MIKHHPFHIVNISPWPLIRSINTLSLTSRVVIIIWIKNLTPFFLAILLILRSSIVWWRDIFRESLFQGEHTKIVIKGLKIGILLFILSEVLFFVSFFWTYFHSSLSSNVELGFLWPPLYIDYVNPTQVPLLNTIILLYSGASITWAHHSLLNCLPKKRSFTILTTIILGVWFTILQLVEYGETTYSVNESTYGSIFFVATGFHGLHVIIGTTFLIVNFKKIIKKRISHTHHIGFEIAAWYWHFVDVVWLFLYISIYWLVWWNDCNQILLPYYSISIIKYH